MYLSGRVTRLIVTPSIVIGSIKAVAANLDYLIIRIGMAHGNMI